MDHSKLEETIRSGRRLVVFLHDNPDPDAIAAGWILQRIGRRLAGRSLIVYGGRLGRAENRAMVELLRIPLRNLNERKLRYFRTDRYALVDTQPGAGNNSFPHRLKRCHLVIDHHARVPEVEARFVDIRPQEGSCTTMLLDYYNALQFDLDQDLATAAAYAIVSETQDLRREATSADRRALAGVLPLARLPVLGRIRHPKHDREYYRTVARAMQQVLVSKNTCVCHIGRVHQPEIVAEVADFLIPMEMVTWCLVSGLYEGGMVLSIRTTHHNARAGLIMKRVLGKMGKGGGHDMIAGGRIACKTIDDYQKIAPKITERFISRLSRKVSPQLRPLLGEDEPGNRSD